MRTNGGNILFLILLAVVLFAALAYAVTSSMRGGGKNASSERADMLASQILNAAALLENTIQREMLLNNVKEYGFDVSGENSNSAGNGTCTAQNCRLLTGNGGSVALPALPVWATNNPVVASIKANIWMIEIVDVGTPEDDLVLVYRYLTNEMCNALNRLVGASDIVVSPSVQDGVNGASIVDYNYSGTLTAMPSSAAAYGDADPKLRGRRASCHTNNGEVLPALAQNVFIYVLLAR